MLSSPGEQARAGERSLLRYRRLVAGHVAAVGRMCIQDEYGIVKTKRPFTEERALGNVTRDAVAHLLIMITVAQYEIPSPPPPHPPALPPADYGKLDDEYNLPPLPIRYFEGWRRLVMTL